MINNWIGIKNENYQVMIYGLKNKEISYRKAFAPLQHVIYRGIDHQVASIDNNCFVTFSYCDTIFQIKNDSVIPRYQYVFSRGEEDKPVDYLDDKKETPELIKGLTNIYQTSNSLILRFSQGRESRWAFFDKNNPSDSCKIYKGFKISDLGNYLLTGTEITNNSIISFFDDAASFKMYFETYLEKKPFKNEQDKNKIKEEVAKIKDDDNPVIFKFTLK